MDRPIIVCPVSLAVQASRKLPNDMDLVVVNDSDFEKVVAALTGAMPPGKRLTIYRWNPAPEGKEGSC